MKHSGYSYILKFHKEKHLVLLVHVQYIYSHVALWNFSHTYKR